LGQNLSRIQGAQSSPARSRLVELVILGKATPGEVMSLGAEIARRGLFTEADPERHGRPNDHIQNGALLGLLGIGEGRFPSVSPLVAHSLTQTHQRRHTNIAFSDTKRWPSASWSLIGR
jgi:hypothetical protein